MNDDVKNKILDLVKAILDENRVTIGDIYLSIRNDEDVQIVHINEDYGENIKVTIVAPKFNFNLSFEYGDNYLPF